MRKPYQFAFHDNVKSEPPRVAMWDRCLMSQPLSREEKDKIFGSIHNQHNGGDYRLAGWAFPFRQFMKRFVVKYGYDNSWTEIWAFDKMCIRKNSYTKSNIIEIHELPIVKTLI